MARFVKIDDNRVVNVDTITDIKLEVNTRNTIFEVTLTLVNANKLFKNFITKDEALVFINNITMRGI
jgi:hypothetical protein